MTSNPEKPGLEPPPYDQAGGYPGAPPASAPPGNPGAPPPQGYPGGPPPQGHPGAPPPGVPLPQGYPGAPPPGAPLPQGYPGAPPPGAPPPQGYPGAPPPGGGPAYPEMKQQYVPPQGGPPQQGVYPDLPAQGGYPGGPPVQGYPGGPPQQVVQVGQPQPATVIISAPRVGKDPVTMECPSCRAHITTRIETDAGLLAWLVCGGMFLAGFFVGCTWFCCCIPFCSSNMQDTTHHCPACGHFIGKYKAAF